LSGERYRTTVPPLDVSVVSEKLSGQIVVLHSPEVLSSTAVKLSWDVRRNRQFVEGFRIKYRPASGIEQSDLKCILCFTRYRAAKRYAPLIAFGCGRRPTVTCCLLSNAFEMAPRALLLVVYVFTPRPLLLSLHGIIYATWYTSHLPEPTGV